jgi:TIR domain
MGRPKFQANGLLMTEAQGNTKPAPELMSQAPARGRIAAERYHNRTLLDNNFTEYCAYRLASQAAAMAEIFISYSSRQRDVTRALAAAIEAEHGIGSVWWDQAGLRCGDRFNTEITQALDDAKAVVVVWTKGSVASDWVYAEAVRAAGQRKVVTVRSPDLDPNLIPLPFNVYHTSVVDDISAVLASIAKRLSGKPSELPSALPGPGFLLDPKQEALPARAIVTRPAALLLAKHRLVPFDDIHGLRAEFVQWATGAPAHALGSPALGRLVHAAAGLGKTRALIEIADELVRAHGWLAGFVPRDIRGAGRELSEAVLERLILRGRDARGLMLIVDYAESRQEDVVWLADRLVRRAETIAMPARLVLLSRGAGDWWREPLRKSQSLQELCSLGGDAYDEIEIPERIARPDRRSLFAASVDAFRAHRRPLDPHPAEPRPPAARPHRCSRYRARLRSPARRADCRAAPRSWCRYGAPPRDGTSARPHSRPRIRALGQGAEDRRPTELAGGGQERCRAGDPCRGCRQREGRRGADRSRSLFREAQDIDVPRVRHMLSLIFPSADVISE